MQETGVRRHGPTQARGVRPIPRTRDRELTGTPRTLLLMCIGLACVGALWADGPAPWQLTLRAPKTACVFDVAETPHVLAVVRNVAGTETATKLSFEVSDYNGKVLNTGETALDVPKGETRQADLALGDPAKLPHEEYLAVKVTLTADGKQQAEWRKGFGLLPKRTVTTPPEASSFGLLMEAYWPLAQRLGVRYVRPNWNWDERLMDWTKRYGIADCPMINEANAFVRGELTEKEYSDFVYESVRRYKGYIKYWQLGNEFDIFHRDGPKAYVESQRIGYAAAKRADPNCVIVGGSITELQCRKEGWPESLQLGLPKYCDIYDFHFYQDLKTTQDMLDYIRATCKQLHTEKPIWVTETTQVNMLDPDDRNQAEYMFKRYAHLLANGVSVVMWHCYSWPYPFEADKVAATSVADHDGFARPSLFAFAALTRTLDGAKFVKRWDAGDGVYVYQFAREGKSLLMVWSEVGDRKLIVQAPPGVVAVSSPDGNRATLPSAGELTVMATKAPVLCVLPGAPTHVR